MARIFLAHTPEMRRNYYGAKALDGLQALGPVTLHEGAEPLDAAGLIAAARGARIIVADRMTAGPGEIFEALTELAAFVRVAVDIRNVDVAAASRAGVLVTQAGPGFVDSVVELTLGFMVDLARGVTEAAAAYRGRQPPDVRMGRQLAGSTLGIIGYGSIGRRLAELGVALRMEVLVADPFATVAADGVRQVPQDALLAAADFVACLAVATPKTENLMDAGAFARMKKGAFFINMSRGNLVDEAALERALRDGHLGGAAMDVGRAPDQQPSPALAALPNVLATPHIGGLTPPAIEHQALETVAQAGSILRGETPRGAVNAERWTRRALISPL